MYDTIYIWIYIEGGESIALIIIVKKKKKAPKPLFMLHTEQLILIIC